MHICVLGVKIYTAARACFSVHSGIQTLFPSIYCKRTAPKLLYVGKGFKVRVDHHHDVMQFSTLDLPKPCSSVRSFKFAKLSLIGCCTKAVEHFLFCA